MLSFKLTYHHVLTYLREKFPQVAELFSDILNLKNFIFIANCLNSEMNLF